MIKTPEYKILSKTGLYEPEPDKASEITEHPGLGVSEAKKGFLSG